MYKTVESFELAACNFESYNETLPPMVIISLPIFNHIKAKTLVTHRDVLEVLVGGGHVRPGFVGQRPHNHCGPILVSLNEFFHHLQVMR